MCALPIKLGFNKVSNSQPGDQFFLSKIIYGISLHIYAHAYTTNGQNTATNFWWMNVHSKIAIWAKYQWWKGFVKCTFLGHHTFDMPENDFYQ